MNKDELKIKRYSQTLSEMIQYKTVSNKEDTNKDEIYRLHDYFKSRFPLIAKQGKWQDFDGGLLIKLKGKSAESPLLLMSHMDVVEAKGDWEKEPFSGEIDKKVIWGRGSVDTKASLAAIFEAIEELLEENIELAQDLYIFSSSREEIAGDDAPNVAKYLKEQGVQLELLVDEGGAILENPMAGINGRFAMIAVSERATAKVLVKAKKHKNQAAMERLSRFILQMKNKKLSERNFPPEVMEMFKQMKPNMDFMMKLIFSNLWIFKPILLRLLPKLSAEATAMIGATLTFNNPTNKELDLLQPGEAGIIASIGSTYHHNIHDAVAKLKSYAKKYGLETEIIEIRETVKPEPLYSEGYNFLASVISEVFKDTKPSPFIIFGGTDARHFVDISNSVMRFVPLYFSNQQFRTVHNVNENVNIQSLYEAVIFYKKLIKNYQAKYS